MLSEEFAEVNSAACTPQQQLNKFIAVSLKGTDISDITPMRYATVLTKIKGDMDEALYGSSDGEQDLKVERALTKQLILLEAIEIKKVLDNPCFSSQKRALEDIVAHGSMSSARLFGVKSKAPEQTNELDLAL